MFITSLRFFNSCNRTNINIESHKNIAIYGAGTAGRQLVEALKWNNQYQVRLLIDDNPQLHGQSLAGLRIEDFDSACKKLPLLGIETILLATPSVPYTYTSVFLAC